MKHATTIVGHFLTRAEAARLCGTSPAELSVRPDALPLSGRCALEEVYPSFAFDSDGLRSDVGEVVTALRTTVGPWDAAGWLTTPNDSLGGTTPLQRIGEVGPEPVLGIL